MKNNTTVAQGVGFESRNGFIWPDVFEDEKAAVKWIEKELNMTWGDITRRAGIRMVDVEVAPKKLRHRNVSV